KLSDRYYTLTKSSLVDVCGIVLDNFADNTIPGATVEILGTDIAQISDVNGLFNLKAVPRKASLKIRYLGYLTKYMSVEELLQQDECPKILLSQHYEELDEVIVYKFLTSGIIKEKDASISLNTSE